MASRLALTEEAISYAWTSFKAKPGVFIGFTLGLLFINFLPGLIFGQFIEKGTVSGIVLQIVLMVYQSFINLLLTRAALDFFDTGTIRLKDWGMYLPRLPKYIVTNLLFVVIAMIGFLLFIIPGFIVLFMFFFASYIVADKNLGPIEALKESRRITTGIKWDLFILSFVLGFINLAAILTLGLGWLVTLPMTILAFTYVYRKASRHTAATLVEAL